MVEDEVREVRVVGKDHARPIGHCKDNIVFILSGFMNLVDLSSPIT